LAATQIKKGTQHCQQEIAILDGRPNLSRFLMRSPKKPT
jgi:hypothetical protein